MITMKKFKKIFVSTFLFLLFFNFNAYSEVVNKVETTGNKRISSETILVFGDIVVGNNYERSDINLLIKKLYESNFFSNISVKLENNILIIDVKENSLINLIILDGEKAEKFRDKIKEIMILREKSSFISNNVKQDINIIKMFYRTLGYYFVKIDSEIEQLDSNRVNLIYTIDKGKKAKISKIYFLGDKKIRDKKLRDIITSQESKFWKFISRNVYLNSARIDLDKRLLKSYYRNKGYYEASITSSNIEYSEGEGFVLTYSINAGTRYRFSKIFANVAESLDKKAFITLEPEFNKLIGKYYSQQKLNNLLEKIDKLSEQKELQFINHGVSENLDGDEVEVKINIFEGKKVIIERINIVGNTVTNDSVIRGEMIVDEGDPYSALLVNKSINKIKSRRLFGVVTQKMLPGSKEDLKVLEISVEETSTGEIMAGAGVGTDGTSFMFSINENNWLGKGIKFENTLNVSAEQISGNLMLSDPNYKFTGNEVRTSFDISSSDRTATSGFKSKKTGLGLGTSFEQYEDVYFSPELTFALEDIQTDSTASAGIKKMEGDYTNIDFLYSLIFDKRDLIYKPTEGYRASFTQSLPILQDRSSILNGVNYDIYHDFSEDVIGSIKFHGRAINGIDDDVRLTKRLYIPRKRLRGFNTYKTGPKDGDDFIGGNYVTGLSAEAQLPNLLPESYKTDFSVFIDTANVWGVDYSSTLNETNSIRSAIGIGANVFTPIGPLSFVLAQSMTKATTDQTERFNFQLGTSF